MPRCKCAPIGVVLAFRDFHQPAVTMNEFLLSQYFMVLHIGVKPLVLNGSESVLPKSQQQFGIVGRTMM